MRKSAVVTTQSPAGSQVETVASLPTRLLQGTLLIPWPGEFGIKRRTAIMAAEKNGKGNTGKYQFLIGRTFNVHPRARLGQMMGRNWMAYGRLPSRELFGKFGCLTTAKRASDFPKCNCNDPR